MVKSMFAAIAGLRAHQSKMDVIGNNIANVNTYGFKTARTTFQESIYQTLSASTAGNAVFGGTNPSQIGYGSTVASIDLNFSTSSYVPTGVATDCMIDGEGFFVVGQKLAGTVSTSNKELTGSSTEALDQLSLSRVGNFKTDGDGYLVDANGYLVYGFTVASDGTVSSELSPIRIPVDPSDPTQRMNLGSISIDSNGNVTGVSDTNTVVSIGRIAVAYVSNPNGLEKVQGPYYRIAGNVGTVEAFSPSEGSTGSLMTSGLEMSNVDLANEFSDMITTQRGFQANSRIITVTDEMLEELVNLKR